MEFIKLARFLLSLLFVFHAVRDSSAHHVDQGRKLKWDMPMSWSKENIAPVKMGFSHHDSPAAVAEKQGLGGRKMMWKKEDLWVEGLEGESLKKTENDNNASKEFLVENQLHLNDQKQGKVSEAKTTDFAQQEEPNRLIEANDREVRNLMIKDYMGMNNPRRKPPQMPPINSHKPTD